MTYQVVVLDDDKGTRRIIQSALSDDGYLVDLAADAEEALEVIRLNPPDLFITDVDHPGLDGFELTARIRESSMVPIIFVTARADTASVVRGFELGADGYMTKPFEMRELVARIRSVLRRSSRTSRLQLLT